jgi:hypothetical protein
MTIENKMPKIKTIDGSTDLSNVGPDDYVSFQGQNSKRAILFPAGQVLDANRTPINEVEDGSFENLNGDTVVKLGGEIIAIVEKQT